MLSSMPEFDSKCNTERHSVLRKSFIVSLAPQEEEMILRYTGIWVVKRKNKANIWLIFLF